MAGVLLFLAAPAGAATQVTGWGGEVVRLDAPPKRIVTIFASNTEIVAALGLTDRIVGIDGLTKYPPEALHAPRVSGRQGFSVDAIVAARPDLVIVTPARQAAFMLADPMRRLGIPTLVLNSRTVAEVIANIETVAVLCGVASRGDALARQLTARIDNIAANIPKRRPGVVMITGRVGNGMLSVARPNTYTGDAIRLAGGRFALDPKMALSAISPEELLRADPEVLLYAGSQSEREELLSSPGWSRSQAVRGGHVYTVSRSEFLIPGPRTIDGIESLAALLRKLSM